MNFEVRWLISENNRLLIEFVEKITWLDFYAAIEQANQMIAPVLHRVDIIILDHVGMPPGYPLEHIRRVVSNQPPNVGTVLITTSMMTPRVLAFVIRLTEVAERLFSNKKMPRFVSSFDEAVALLDREQTPVAQS